MILPGVPGMESLRVDGDHVPYPDSTPDMAKVLREMGFDVRFTEPREARRYVGHKAWEIWLPVLVVTSEVLLALGSGILVEVVKSYFSNEVAPPDESGDEEQILNAVLADNKGAEGQPYIHVDWRVELPDGREERFTASGDADAVLESLDGFERHVREI